MKFLGVKFKLFECKDKYVITIDNEHTISSYSFEKGAIDYAKNFILRYEWKYKFKSEWNKYAPGMGYDYYLKQDNFYFFITKLNSDRYPSKVEWKFEAFEYRDSMYTSNYCLTICNTLSEAKRCIFNAYKFLSKNIVRNYKSDIINTPIIIDILKSKQ